MRFWTFRTLQQKPWVDIPKRHWTTWFDDGNPLNICILRVTSEMFQGVVGILMISCWFFREDKHSPHLVFWKAAYNRYVARLQEPRFTCSTAKNTPANDTGNGKIFRGKSMSSWAMIFGDKHPYICSRFLLLDICFANFEFPDILKTHPRSHVLPCFSRWWFQMLFIFTPMGKISNLTHIFQMGWEKNTHQQVWFFSPTNTSSFL